MLIEVNFQLEVLKTLWVTNEILMIKFIFYGMYFILRLSQQNY